MHEKCDKHFVDKLDEHVRDTKSDLLQRAAAVACTAGGPGGSGSSDSGGWSIEKVLTAMIDHKPFQEVRVK